MEPDKLEKLRSNIHKTGFVLEFQVSKILQEHKWNVINNRYYIDDIQRTVREIDIIAYKSIGIKDIKYFTTLIISCKKSDEKFWAFLTKNLYQSDPNIDFYPIFNWSNDRVLDYMLEKHDWKNKLIEEIEKKGFLKEIYSIPSQVFAFQEMSKKNLKPQDDRSIFNSIESLIKAQSYELLCLGDRKKEKRFYNFNLISIADTELIEVDLEFPDFTLQEISGTKYLNRYIVNQKDSFFRIDFIKFDAFDKYLKNYDKLHNWNRTFYPKLIDKFYEDIFDSEEKTELQMDQIKKNIIWYLNHLIRHTHSEIEEIEFFYSPREKLLEIELSAKETIGEIIITFLNESDKAKTRMSKTLNEYFRYTGKFEFSSCVPF